MDNNIISYTGNVFIVKDSEKTREFTRTFDSGDFLKNRSDALDYVNSLAEVLNEAAHLGIDKVDKDKINEFQLGQIHQFDLMNISLIGCMVMCNLPNDLFGRRVDLFGSDYFDLGGPEYADMYNNNLRALALELNLLNRAVDTNLGYMIVENLAEEKFKILDHRVNDVCMAIRMLE
jgi:hypothetical protein